MSSNSNVTDHILNSTPTLQLLTLLAVNLLSGYYIFVASLLDYQPHGLAYALFTNIFIQLWTVAMLYMIIQQRRLEATGSSAELFRAELLKAWCAMLLWWFSSQHHSWPAGVEGKQAELRRHIVGGVVVPMLFWLPCYLRYRVSRQVDPTPDLAVEEKQEVKS